MPAVFARDVRQNHSLEQNAIICIILLTLSTKQTFHVFLRLWDCVLRKDQLSVWKPNFIEWFIACSVRFHVSFSSTPSFQNFRNTCSSAQRSQHDVKLQATASDNVVVWDRPKRALASLDPMLPLPKIENARAQRSADATLPAIFGMMKLEYFYAAFIAGKNSSPSAYYQFCIAGIARKQTWRLLNQMKMNFKVWRHRSAEGVDGGLAITLSWPSMPFCLLKNFENLDQKWMPQDKLDIEWYLNKLSEA